MGDEVMERASKMITTSSVELVRLFHQAVLFPDINVSNNKRKLLAFGSILEKTSIIPKEGEVAMC